LTGASGSLGTALLETLSASPRVERIYALIRGPHHLEKLRIAMQERGLDASLLNVGGKVTVMNLSMQDPLLGLSVEEYFELAQNVTIVLQNAWKMDFNQGVEEFEGDCIRSASHPIYPLLISRLYTPFDNMNHIRA
jgi:thioester reductase-like protein